jgi:hypothetical protein
MSASVAGDSAPTFRADSPVAPYKNNRASVFITLSVALVIVVAGFAVSGTLLIRYAAKFTQMDRTRESLSWDGGPGPVLHTIYRNPAYGVTLILPGAWKPGHAPTPYLCHLIGFGRFSAVFAAAFPAFSSSVDGDAALVTKRYEANGWTLNSEESTTIRDLPAHILHLTSHRALDVDVVMVKKWPVDYELSVAGQSADSEQWEIIHAALRQAIQIR